MGVGERIRELREKRKMAGVHLASRAGVNQSYLSKLERGKAGFSEEGLEKIARALGTSVATLFGSGSLAVAPLTAGVAVPILDYTQAGDPPDLAGKNEVEEYVLVNGEGNGDLFALYIRDNSNFPEFRIGDLIIVERSMRPRPGDFVIAVDGSGHAIFRRYKVLKTSERGETIFALVPLNDDFPTLRSDELPLALRGVMVEHRKYRRT